MLTPFLALLAVGSAQAAQTPPPAPGQATPGQIVEKALARYSNAKSMSGKLNLTQTAGGAKVTVDTAIQFDQPSKLYMRQVRQSSEPRQWVVVSDGKDWSYDKPEGVLGPPRFVEHVVQNGFSQTLRNMYGTAAKSMGDRSPILDIAIARPEDMRMVLNQWANMRIHSRVKLRGVDTTAIVGQFRESINHPISGTYEAYFSDSYDFMRFVLKQKFQVPDGQSVEVLSVWDADLKLDVVTDPALYRVIR